MNELMACMEIPNEQFSILVLNSKQELSPGNPLLGSPVKFLVYMGAAAEGNFLKPSGLQFRG